MTTYAKFISGNCDGKVVIGCDISDNFGSFLIRYETVVDQFKSTLATIDVVLEILKEKTYIVPNARGLMGLLQNYSTYWGKKYDLNWKLSLDNIMANPAHFSAQELEEAKFNNVLELTLQRNPGLKEVSESISFVFHPIVGQTKSLLPMPDNYKPCSDENEAKELIEEGTEKRINRSIEEEVEAAVEEAVEAVVNEVVNEVTQEVRESPQNAYSCVMGDPMLTFFKVVYKRNSQQSGPIPEESEESAEESVEEKAEEKVEEKVDESADEKIEQLEQLVERIINLSVFSNTSDIEVVQKIADKMKESYAYNNDSDTSSESSEDDELPDLVNSDDELPDLVIKQKSSVPTPHPPSPDGYVCIPEKDNSDVDYVKVEQELITHTFVMTRRAPNAFPKYSLDIDEENILTHKFVFDGHNVEDENVETVRNLIKMLPETEQDKINGCSCSCASVKNRGILRVAGYSEEEMNNPQNKNWEKLMSYLNKMMINWIFRTYKVNTIEFLPSDILGNFVVKITCPKKLTEESVDKFIEETNPFNKAGKYVVSEHLF